MGISPTTPRYHMHVDIMRPTRSFNTRKESIDRPLAMKCEVRYERYVRTYARLIIRLHTASSLNNFENTKVLVLYWEQEITARFACRHKRPINNTMIIKDIGCSADCILTTIYCRSILRRRFCDHKACTRHLSLSIRVGLKNQLGLQCAGCPRVQGTAQC